MPKVIERKRKAGFLLTRKNKFVHREVYLAHHKFLPKGWFVYHVDRNKDNNRIENLIAVPKQIMAVLYDLPNVPGRETIEQWVIEYRENKDGLVTRRRPPKECRGDIKKARKILRANGGKSSRERKVAAGEMSKEVEEFLKANPDKVRVFRSFIPT